jgi:hypothetical protein
MDQSRSMSRRAAVTGFGALGLGLVGLQHAAGDDKRTAEEETIVEAHIYPYRLGEGDKLSDGGKKEFKVKEPTLLIWVDLLAGGKFAHGTEYVLISRSGTRVEKGAWWPVLNGNTLFDTRNNPAVASPFLVDRHLKSTPFAVLPIYVKAHIYPYELKLGDKLSDGGKKDYNIKEPTLLIWVTVFEVDSEPRTRGERPKEEAKRVECILISRPGTRVEEVKGQPILNGNTLFSTDGNMAVVSPVVLAKTGPGGTRFRTTDR